MLQAIEKKLREWFDRPKIGVTHYVELRCPKTDETIATEQTEPIHTKRDIEGGTSIMTYACDSCSDRHSYLWGPPTPIHVHEPDEVARSYTCSNCGYTETIRHLPNGGGVLVPCPDCGQGRPFREVF